MDKYFDNFYNYEGFGPSVSPVHPSTATCKDYEGLLPDQLISYWKEYGFSGWGGGLFWNVNPHDYDPILSAWLEGTPFKDQDEFHVIARTAFGKLYIWGKETGESLTIQSQYGTFFPDEGQRQNILEDGEDLCISLFFSTMDKEYCSLLDESDKPLFDRAKEKLGVLNHDEMYAFVPALALGGKADLKFLQKVKIIEHLAFLADVCEKHIMADVNKVLGPVNI